MPDWPWGKRTKPTSPEALEARLRGLTHAVDELVARARRDAEAEQDRALGVLSAAKHAATSHAEQARAATEQRVQEALAAAAPRAGTLAAGLAPGLGSMAPDAPEWRSRDFVGTGATAHVRLGTLGVAGAASVPVVVPLLHTDGWEVMADNRAAAHRLVVGAAVRLMASAEPFRLRIDTFDPRLGGGMGVLGHLTTKFPQLVSRPVHTTEHFQQTLSGLVDVSSMRANRMAQLGHRSFADLLRGSERATDPYRLVVVFDYPYGIDARLQSDLVRLAATGADRGIVFLVHHDPTITVERDVEPSALLDHLGLIRVSRGMGTAEALADVQIRLDPGFEAAAATEICELVAELAERAELPTIEFIDTLPDRSVWWRRVHDELSAVIGYDDRTPATVRLRSGNPALPHILVGGAVGQGKSNLLLVLIHALAATYSPRDLQMYLLDFKHGVEFSALGPSPQRNYWLPHARVLGVHSDRPFGLAVLRHLSDELARRSDVFKAHGDVTDVSQLPPEAERLPRILVVLDEFQVLLEDDDELADEASRLIERLVRLGRAYGVHVVLATQTIEGVKRLATRRDSIFGQVPYRIALKTTPTDSQAILRGGNTAAAALQFRGEAILNANFGSPDDNQHVLVSFADRAVLDGLRRDLWAMADDDGGVRPPRIFDLGEPARLLDAARLVEAARLVDAGSDTSPDAETTAAYDDVPDVTPVWAGMPIAVTEAPATIDVRHDPGAGVLILGDGPADALGVLSGLAVSAAASVGPRPRFVVLDAVGSDRSTAEGKAALVTTLRGLGSEVELVGRGDVTERLFALRDSVNAGSLDTPTYLIGFGMHAVPRMTMHADGRFESPADALQEIVKLGPAAGVVTFGWWNRLHVSTEHLGFGRSNVTAHLFLRHPQDGVRSVCGPLVRWSSEPCRALLWDGLSAEPPVVVPFAPLREADVAGLVELVRP